MTDPDGRFEDWLQQHRVEPLGPPPGVYEQIARAARRRRAVRVTAVSAAAVVLGAGVAGLAYRIVEGPPPVPVPGASASRPPSPPAISAGPTDTGSASAVGAGGPSSGGAAGGPASSGGATTQQIGRCHTGDLKVTAQGAMSGGGEMNNRYVWLVFTNTSSRSCTLYGYPGVSWVAGDSGQQVNEATVRKSGTTPARFTLAPQASGHATVHDGNPDAFGPECQPVEVRGYRVYPPDETAAIFVPWAVMACSGRGVNVGTVSPLVPGLSE
ncbi:DUF4232 domain-containing protein [Dactylosporangium vinaceum]|uniref:DUF4232 domain-containing protein n=1 Tax=Dactylosporangium vinaceum TaxID=53362 RepID=A0ABV5MQE0_9ACTN|nr:DUF4232 domain-containing protein [Dactylosporangium vinaceum]UAB96481.1 DUF4232 domain-containing protein [Dactylosporangium vinaceum]